MASSTLTSKGQTTIPKEIRSRLHLETGDRVEYVVEDDGRVVLRPLTAPISALAGMLQAKSRKPVSIEDMDEAIAREASRGASRVR